MLTLAAPPCRENCPRRAWDCHKAGNCKAYDDFVRTCERLRHDRQLETEVNMAVSDGVGRNPGERRA